MCGIDLKEGQCGWDSESEEEKRKNQYTGLHQSTNLLFKRTVKNGKKILYTKYMNKNLLQLNNELPTYKMSKRFKYFTKDMQMVNKDMERCSTSLVIRNMQIKTRMHYHYTHYNNVN